MSQAEYEREVAALRARQAQGLTLTPHQKLHIANRLMLQAPKHQTEAERAAFVRSMNSRVNNLPADVLFTLKAIQLLADQGNKVAAALFDEESERLGLTRKSTFA